MSAERNLPAAGATPATAETTMRARAWSVDASGLHVIDPAGAAALALTGDVRVWLDLDGCGGDQARQLLRPLDIHPLAIEDMLTQINRPKVDDYGAYLYLAVHSARWDDDRPPTLREIDVLVGTNFLVTYHEGATRSIDSAERVLVRRPELLGRGPAYLLHFILDVLVDNYLPITDALAAQLDGLEEDVFRATSRRVHVRILRLKRGMAAMRRIVGPQRDTMLALTRDEFRAIPAEVRPYLRDVYDRLARVGDLLDSFRDELSGLLDLYVSQVSNRLNQTIKVLTVAATFALPLTIITSYYGMNLQIASYHWRHGEAYVLGLMAGSVLITWWWLRRNRWV
jgi:magnesium transporter